VVRTMFLRRTNKVVFKIAKSELTKRLELEIWKATKAQGTFGCFEVTIGWFGKERVDYMTYNTKGEFRCYEIKISKSDFYSKAHKTFVGHFNYYVMPKSLFNELSAEIPNGIGVYAIGDSEYDVMRCVKKPKRMELKVNEQILKDSLIRSLCRDVDKQVRSGKPTLIEVYKREIREAKARGDKWYREYWNLRSRVEEKFGTRWDKEKCTI
jgi:hypothetical protein